MAIVSAKAFTPVRPRHATDEYSTHLRRRAPRQIDPSMFPTGGLGGLGEDLGDPLDTGISLVDDVHHQISDAAFYAKVTAAFAIAAGVCSTVTLWALWPQRGRRRRR